MEMHYKEKANNHLTLFCSDE